MNRTKLNKRLSRKKAVPLKVTANPLDNNRRGKNDVNMNFDEPLTHDDFFEFEEDLIDFRPSRSLAANAPGAGTFFAADVITGEPLESANVMPNHPEEEPIKETQSSFLFMEEADEPEAEPSFGVILDNIDEEDIPEEKKVDYEFVQCTATKADGERCKRQAPNGFVTCSIASHRKQEASTNKKETGDDG